MVRHEMAVTFVTLHHAVDHGNLPFIKYFADHTAVTVLLFYRFDTVSVASLRGLEQEPGK